MKSKKSKRHHYLPIFYLNGFTNSDKKIFVYNKQNDSLLENIEPSSIFFEKNLNNFIHNGEILLSLEDDFFMRHDSRASTFLYQYLEQTIPLTEEIDAEFRFEMIWFLVNLFWRIPNSNKKIEDLILKHGIHNRYFQIVKKTTNEPAPDDLLEKIKNDILTKKENTKIFKTIYPFISAESEEILRLMEMYRSFDMLTSYTLLTGDNPFISNSTYDDLSNILGEVIFPLSGKKLVIAAKEVPTYINLNLLMNINIAIIHQSERFVCSNSKENLREMIKFYKIFSQENLLNSIVEDTFNLMRLMSKFPNLEEYLKAKQA